MTTTSKQQVLERELAELHRVGRQPFQAMLKDHLVAFDLSVIDGDAHPPRNSEPPSQDRNADETPG